MPSLLQDSLNQIIALNIGVRLTHESYDSNSERKNPRLKSSAKRNVQQDQFRNQKESGNVAHECW